MSFFAGQEKSRRNWDRGYVEINFHPGFKFSYRSHDPTPRSHFFEPPLGCFIPLLKQYSHTGIYSGSQAWL